MEHELSVVENPQLKNQKYNVWLGDAKPLSWKQKLCNAIDNALLQNPANFNAFLAAMKAAGYEVKRQKKNISFLAPGQKKFTRLRSLGDNYSEQGILERIEGKRIVKTERLAPPPPEKMDMMIDIKSKLQEGKGAGCATLKRV